MDTTVDSAFLTVVLGLTKQDKVWRILYVCNKLEACKERKSKLERRFDTGG